MMRLRVLWGPEPSPRWPFPSDGVEHSPAAESFHVGRWRGTDRGRIGLWVTSVPAWERLGGCHPRPRPTGERRFDCMGGRHSRRRKWGGVRFTSEPAGASPPVCPARASPGLRSRAGIRQGKSGERSDHEVPRGTRVRTVAPQPRPAQFSWLQVAGGFHAEPSRARARGLVPHLR